MNSDYSWSCKECFSKAATLFSPPIGSVEMQYEGTTLLGYFYRVDDNNTIRSTLITHGGFDSTSEGLHTFAVAPELEGGHNCLTFKGPS